MCNRTKNNESTFFILNVIIGKLIVQNWVLLNMNEYAKRSAESILMLYIYRPLFPWYIWGKLNLVHASYPSSIQKQQKNIWTDTF